MSAFLELQSTGRVGPETATLLYTIVETALRRHGGRLPVDLTWNEHVLETAHDFLVERGTQRITSLYLRATDDTSLARLLWVSVLNYLRDRARETDRGALHRRLVDVINREDNKLIALDTGVGRVWAIPEVAKGQPWNGDEQELLKAAWSVENIQLIRWRQGIRRSPVAEAEDLARVLTAVIRHAGAPVPVAVMLRVMETRFALGRLPDLLEVEDEPAEPLADDSATLALSRLTAVEVFNQLSAQERIVLAHLEDNVRTLGQRLGVSKSTAATLKIRLQQILSTALRQDEDIEATWTQLQELAVTFATSWTPEPSSPSTEGEST